MTGITQLSQLDLDKDYSYADYLTWQFDEAVELIKGKIMLMSPAPNANHQTISWQLSGILYNYFKNKNCKAFAAPFDVSLYDRKKSFVANKKIRSVVQPDLCVICDTKKLNKQGCTGAPDWIIEILSKGNSKKEMQLKYNLYEESGVLEYWIIYPYEKALHQFVFDKISEKYQLQGMFSDDDEVRPHVFPDLQIDLNEVFES
jgi:Uma2 family endonuclease